MAVCTWKLQPCGADATAIRHWFCRGLAKSLQSLAQIAAEWVIDIIQFMLLKLFYVYVLFYVLCFVMFYVTSRWHDFFCAQVTVALQHSGAKNRQHGHRIISHRLPSQLGVLSIGPNSHPKCVRAVCRVHLEHCDICQYQDTVCPASIGGQHYRRLAQR